MNRRPSQTRNRHPSRHWERLRTTSPEEFASSYQQPKEKPAAFLLRALLFLFAALLIGNAVANRFVHVFRISVPLTALPADLDGYTILHLSDLKGVEFGKDQSGFRDALRHERFDAVLLSGDMISPLGNPQPLYDLINLLKQLQPKAEIWFIPGDSDPEILSMQHASGGTPYAPWVLGAEHRGAKLLNAPVLLASKSVSIWVASSSELNLDIDSQQRRFEELWLNAKSTGDENQTDLAEYNLKRLSGLREAQSAMKKEDLCIAVSHVPPDDSYLSSLVAPSGREPDLLLCGHWLGGLINLPAAGALFVPSKDLPNYGLFPGDLYRSLMKSRTTWVYHNPGLGNWDSHYPVFFRRLFNPPCAALLTLVPSSL